MFAPPKPALLGLSSCQRAQYLVRSPDFADAGAFAFYSTSIDLSKWFQSTNLLRGNYHWLPNTWQQYLGALRNLNSCPWEASFPIYQALNIVLRYNLAVFICFTSSAWLPISGFSALHWAKSLQAFEEHSTHAELSRMFWLAKKWWEFKRIILRNPRTEFSHLVRKQNSPYDIKQLVGLRFLESRKPYRSTWLPQALCGGLRNRSCLLSWELNG